MLENDATPARRPPPIPGAERRTAPRVELDIGVGFSSDTNFYTGFTEDLSEGGLFVATHKLQPVGTVLKLTFTLPTGIEISTEGVVRWLRDPRNYDANAVPGMGVQFRALTAEAARLVREFIALREPMFYDV